MMYCLLDQFSPSKIIMGGGGGGEGHHLHLLFCQSVYIQLQKNESRQCPKLSFNKFLSHLTSSYYS